MRREFTGRDMAKILVAGFGVVVAVNFGMATIAARSFSGTVVDNSYIASQKFNGWLEEARRSEQLGWSATIERDENGFLAVPTRNVPAGAAVSAELRRPIGERETQAVAFSRTDENFYRSDAPIDEGRWIARLTIASGELIWTSEAPLE